MTRILAIVGALSAATLLGGWTFGFDRQGPFCLYDRGNTNCGYPVTPKVNKASFNESDAIMLLEPTIA